jgi:hypothetical protein
MSKPTLKDFLEVAFNPDEYVFTCTASVNKGPPIHNRTSRSRAQTETLAGFQTEGGVFIGANPSDQSGTYDKGNVTAIRNLVFEFDEMVNPDGSKSIIPKATQARIVKALGIPHSAVVWSGGKSLHFWICLDTAIDQFTFKCYMSRLLLYIKLNAAKAVGLEGEVQADPSTCKENQLMRFPTAFRGDQEQTLYGVKSRISESDFCFNFINEKCPPYTPPVPKPGDGRIKKSSRVWTEDEAEKHCNEKWPLEAGQKQNGLASWATFLVGNTNLKREEIIDLIARNDMGKNRRVSEYERAVDRVLAMEVN